MKYLRMFLSLFKKNNTPSVIKTEPVQIPANLPTQTSSNIKRIAILVGHGAGDSGASCWNGQEEHAYNSQVADYIDAQYTGKTIEIFYKTSNGWAPTYLKIALFKPDLTIELHLNAANSTAVGCEVLCVNEKSAEIGRKFASAFTAQFNRKLRRDKGILMLSKGDRGYLNVKGCNVFSKYSILVEPMFCDNKNEWINVEVYAKWFVSWLKGL